MSKDGYLASRLAKFHNLRGASGGMGLYSPALGPSVRFVVVVNIAQEKVVRGTVDDDAHIKVHSH